VVCRVAVKTNRRRRIPSGLLITTGWDNGGDCRGYTADRVRKSGGGILKFPAVTSAGDSQRRLFECGLLGSPRKMLGGNRERPLVWLAGAPAIGRRDSRTRLRTRGVFCTNSPAIRGIFRRTFERSHRGRCSGLWCSDFFKKNVFAVGAGRRAWAVPCGAGWCGELGFQLGGRRGTRSISCVAIWDKKERSRDFAIEGKGGSGWEYARKFPVFGPLVAGAMRGLPRQDSRVLTSGETNDQKRLKSGN